jgi:hypothetical protein
VQIIGKYNKPRPPTRHNSIQTTNLNTNPNASSPTESNNSNANFARSYSPSPSSSTSGAGDHSDAEPADADTLEAPAGVEQPFHARGCCNPQHAHQHEQEQGQNKVKAKGCTPPSLFTRKHPFFTVCFPVPADTDPIGTCRGQQVARLEGLDSTSQDALPDR